jgi:hypothetical protein
MTVHALGRRALPHDPDSERKPSGPVAAGEPRALWKSLADVVAGIREGLAAHRRYETLRARGVPPQRAAAMAVEDSFKRV